MTTNTLPRTLTVLCAGLLAFPALHAAEKKPNILLIIADDMGYTASYEFWLDQSSPQYKSPMGELVHSRRVFTYEDTAVIVPSSDTPYSFVCLDLRAEPYVVSVPAVGKVRYNGFSTAAFGKYHQPLFPRLWSGHRLFQVPSAESKLLVAFEEPQHTRILTISPEFSKASLR